MILGKKRCALSMTLNIFYSLVWGFLPSLILATLVIAMYYGIQDLTDKVPQMNQANISNNESLKEYKFRTKLLMGIVTVFIFSTMILTAYLVSLVLYIWKTRFLSQGWHFSCFHQLWKNVKLSHNLFWRFSCGKLDICLWSLTVHPTFTSTSSYKRGPKGL